MSSTRFARVTAEGVPTSSGVTGQLQVLKHQVAIGSSKEKLGPGTQNKAALHVMHGICDFRIPKMTSTSHHAAGDF